MVCADTNSNLITYAGKGRPKKNTVTKINDSTMVSDINSLRASMRLGQNDTIMLLFCWALDDQVRIAHMFPQALAADTTAGTNNEKRELLLVCLMDSFNKGQIVMQCFLPSQKRYVFSWIFRDVIPTILGVDVVKRNR